MQVNKLPTARRKKVKRIDTLRPNVSNDERCFIQKVAVLGNNLWRTQSAPFLVSKPQIVYSVDIFLKIPKKKILRTLWLGRVTHPASFARLQRLSPYPDSPFVKISQTSGQMNHSKEGCEFERASPGIPFAYSSYVFQKIKKLLKSEIEKAQHETNYSKKSARGIALLWKEHSPCLQDLHSWSICNLRLYTT